MRKILIVEDDKKLREELIIFLNNNDFNAIGLEKFDNTIQDIKNEDPDLILLDINLPNMDGESICRELRKEIQIPIIMVTSRTNEVDEILSISYGADDYITKPYNPTLLLLRINNIFKRMSNQNDVIKYKDIEVNTRKSVITKDNKEIVLTKNEMLILSYLLLNRGKIVSRDELMTDLWNNNEFINDNALTVNISRLRTKLKDIGEQDAIDTRKGQGYILL